jgi:NADH-quinone oxidoreductase subunit L
LEILAIFLPLISYIFITLFENKLSDKAAGGFATLLVSLAALISLVILKQSYNGYVYETILLPWISAGELNINWAIYIDSLAAIMLVVVNSVSALVHIYSGGYMCGEANFNRFFSYLSLFTFFMLVLVSSNNFLQLFLGWEGVGLCSYLLIGFWYQRESAITAANKAFYTNRIADFAMIVAICLIYTVFGSLHFQELFATDSEILASKSCSCITEVICLLLFIGCMGKSAQLGLHIWLPDAMEGPTPVSALIHAATMVTAGVFLLVRCSRLFAFAPIVLEFITIIGALTCLFAGMIAATQTDIKKIIAYSTCSQLGYMILACGISMHQAAIFHLFTHAFFKALLFLAAGNIIHAAGHEHNIFKMGGLKDKIPYTFYSFVIGSLAIMGIYPFAGYFSKDLILESSLIYGAGSGKLAYDCGIIGAIFTAIYSTRLITVVFLGKPSKDLDSSHAHEPSGYMLWPVMGLSVLALISGYLGSKVLGLDLALSNSDSLFAGSLIYSTKDAHILEKAHHLPQLVKYLPALLSLITAAVTYYVCKLSFSENKIFNWLKPIYNAMYNKFYIDEIYYAFIIKPFLSLANIIGVILDRSIIDGYGPGGASDFSKLLGQKVSRSQTGYLFDYTASFLLSVLIFIGFLIYYFSKSIMAFNQFTITNLF